MSLLARPLLHPLSINQPPGQPQQESGCSEVVGELDAGSEDLGAWREAPGAAAAERRDLQSRTRPIRGEISQLRYLAKKTSGKA